MIIVKNIRYHTYEEGTKAFLMKPGLLVNFGKFPCCWIRIWFRIPYTDPGELNQCGSTTLIVPLRSSTMFKACLTHIFGKIYHF